MVHDRRRRGRDTMGVAFNDFDRTSWLGVSTRCACDVLSAYGDLRRRSLAVPVVGDGAELDEKVLNIANLLATAIRRQPIPKVKQ